MILSHRGPGSYVARFLNKKLYIEFREPLGFSSQSFTCFCWPAERLKNGLFGASARRDAFLIGAGSANTQAPTAGERSKYL